MAIAADDVHRRTRAEYERMAAKGFFAPDARVELIDGIVYDLPRHDKNRKIPLDARAGIPEAWLLNLNAGALEVFRDSGPGGYRLHHVLRRGEAVAPLLRPETTIAVAELLPR